MAHRWFAPLLALAFAVLPGSLAAQDFLFGQPSGSVAFRAGYNFARASSELHDFTRQYLTVDKSDFNGIAVAGDLSFWLGSRAEGVLTIGYHGSSADSEFRGFLEDGLPIEQETTTRQLAAVLGGRLYPLPRGRAIGTLAWLPARVSPFLGAGAGIVFHWFRQEGDFVDTLDCDDTGCPIFTSKLESDGWAPVVYAAGGAEIALTSKLALVAEGRYSWAKGELEDDFDGFEDLDLSGLVTTIGLQLRF